MEEVLYQRLFYIWEWRFTIKEWTKGCFEIQVPDKVWQKIKTTTQKTNPFITYLQEKANDFCALQGTNLMTLSIEKNVLIEFQLINNPHLNPSGF